MNRRGISVGRTGATLKVAAVTAVAAVGFALGANAQQLPKSGSIAFHTGWKYAADAVTTADKHVLG